MKRARRIPPSLAHKAATRPRYSLAKLLLRIPAGDSIDDEWDSITPMGREIKPAAATLRTIRAMRRFMRKQQRRRRRAGRDIDLRTLIDEGRD